MKTSLRFALLASALLLWTLPASAQEAKAPSGNAQNGKALFNADGCYQCHGYVGQGAASTGPRLAPDPLPYQAFLQQLRRPAAEMPPYEQAIVSDAQAADIYAYLGSIPKPPDPKSIPLLSGNR
jgi:ubiquinol-cytochrome c reductase cytochrome c subunit